MIKVEKISVMNLENAIRGMRNAHASWDKSDSFHCLHSDEEFDCENCPHLGNACNYFSEEFGGYIIGENDMKLAKALCKAGSDERKFLRQIFVSMDITAHRYWWIEADTYKIGTTSNSTSTMHSIMNKEFTLDDFSMKHVTEICGEHPDITIAQELVNLCNNYRDEYLRTKDKRVWYALIQILPGSYNQLRTWTANYEVLRNIYHARKNHKLDEWREFCKIIETLPYAKELIVE